jgi:hypothetical protein
VNGIAWTLMGSSTVAMASRVYIGLAVTSHNPSVSAGATFTNVSTTGGVSASLTSPARSPNPTIAQPEGTAHVAAGNAIVSASPVNRATSDYDAWPVLTSTTGDATNLAVRRGVPLRHVTELVRASATRPA